MQWKSARTPRPPRVPSTWVQLRSAGSPSLTFSTRWVLGHQRGRWYGSVITSQRALVGAAIRRLRTTRAKGSLVLAGQLAQIADEQHVGEVAARRGEALQVLDRLLAGVLIGRAQAGTDHRLQQYRLTIGGRAEHLEVAAADPEPSELGARLDDLPVGVAVDLRTLDLRGLNQAPVLEVLDQVRTDPGLVDELLERESRALAGIGARGAAKRGPLPSLLPGARGQLLANHPQRQELVPLHAENRPQALDVRLAVEPVSTGCPARREELLVLEVSDLGDRDVLELAGQDLGDSADREGLAIRGRAIRWSGGDPGGRRRSG